MDLMLHTLETILETKVIAIVRAESPARLVDAAQALADGGVRCIEVTMTTPGALDIMRTVATTVEGVVMGVGTVLDPQTARLAILAGARFVVSPSLCPEVIRLCRRYGVVAVPGAYTPTEILSAWETGADLVKVFPVSVGGPDYVKKVHTPLPHVRLCAVGGVTLDDAVAYLRAGAAAVALGSSLISPDSLRTGDFATLTSLAKRLVNSVRTL